MHRTRTGKRLVLTNRDLAIFRWLCRYRYLRSTYLHAFAGGLSETRFKERLGDLFHEGYLDRPEAQWRFADCQHSPAVHELGKGGREALAEAGFAGDERRVLLGQGAHRQFEHSVMICEVLASIELGAIGKPDLRFIPFPEILAKAPEPAHTAAFPLRMSVGQGDERYVVPDAVFGLEYRSGPRRAYRFFALEVDRGTMPIERTDGCLTSLMGKLAAYRKALAHGVHRSHLGIPNLLVMVLTTSSARMDWALAKTKGEPVLLFKSLAPQRLAWPASELLREPWARKELSPLWIGSVE